MPRPLRFLGADSSPATTVSAAATATPSAQQPATLDSDFVVILAALLCALICVLGLVAVARCAWLRRLSAAASSQNSPPQAFPSAANKGLKKKVLRSLPRQTLSADSIPKFSDCAICLAEFAAGDEIRILPQCGHGFHVSCIDTWLGSHSSCPSCRQILVVARCQKCGGVPAPATASSSGGATVAGESECKDVANRFLP
ncbi:RING-H2 finger protein ATL80 [Euphorbia peplus]|nr:RING-H2 finger protein ATL80 [Euphorbia peplus]